MGGVAAAGGRALRLGELDLAAPAVTLHRRHPRRRRLLDLAGRLEPGARRREVRVEGPAPPRKPHRLPTPQLLAQPAVAPGLGRLALQRPPLLLDLVDDVVDPGQVLPRRVELELGRPAAVLVLGDAGRLLEELPPLRGPRPQDLADLALLDHRVGLDADARVHQQILDVAQAADPAVDQVLALARPVQPPADLDVAGDEGQQVVDVGVVGQGLGGRGRGHRVGRHRNCVGRHWNGVGGCRNPVGQRRSRVGRRRNRAPVRVGSADLPRGGRDLGEMQLDLGRADGPAAVAAREDHVLHALAAQALGALLAEDPRDGVDDVALAAAVGADDGGHPVVEHQVGPFGKALEPGDGELMQSHWECPYTKAAARNGGTGITPFRAAGNAAKRLALCERRRAPPALR